MLADVLAATLTRAQKADAEATLENIRALLDLADSDLTDQDAPTLKAGYPGTKVTYSATTSMAGLLPQVRDLVVTTAVADEDDIDTADFDETTDVATGYAANEDPAAADDGENVDVNKNGASQVRIGRSSGVDAPK